MKWIVVFLYVMITWILKFLINILEFIWHLDTKHFSCYGTHFLNVWELRKENEVDISLLEYDDGLNFIERIIYKCLK